VKVVLKGSDVEGKDLFWQKKLKGKKSGLNIEKKCKTLLKIS